MKDKLDSFLGRHSKKIAVVEIVMMVVMTFSFVFLAEKVFQLRNERKDAWEECDFDPSDEPGEPFYKKSEDKSFTSSFLSSSITGRVSKPVNRFSSPSISNSSSFTVIPLKTASNDGVLTVS